MLFYADKGRGGGILPVQRTWIAFSSRPLRGSEVDLTWHGAPCPCPAMCLDRTKLLVEWDASPVNDMLADAIVALAAQAQTR